MYKVEFIGNGYEVVKFVYVEAQNMAQAFTMAAPLCNIPYSYMEIPKEYAYNA